MKKLSLILCGGLAIATTLFSCNKGEEKASTASSSSAAISVDGKKVVFVNTDSLLANYQFYKDAQKEFENKGYRLQVDLGQRERALQTEGAAIQQRAQAMTQAELQAADMMLRKKAGELQQYSQQKQAALAQEQAKKQEELYTNIREYIKKHNAENKYEFVLGYSSNGGGILYADNAVDVTQQIIDGLNKEYAEKKGAAKK
ncbi:MAG: OmpH family outer membrane protein [Flectobacillus sp.]|uniref:OmpH family outer membrane protein n=1 Tax=Flectobacillus sp. TaxID=50419 RepID=UPI003B9B79B4